MSSTGSVIITVIATIVSSIIVMVWITLSASRAEPPEVFLILDRDVTIFNDAHENILHNRHQEKQEAIHEQERINEVYFPH